jgi:hypothetical protein
MSLVSHNPLPALRAIFPLFRGQATALSFPQSGNIFMFPRSGKDWATSTSLAPIYGGKGLRVRGFSEGSGVISISTFTYNIGEFFPKATT